MSPEIVISTDAPFPVDAVVIEEDTGLVLSADTTVDPGRQEHPIRVMTDLLDFEIATPGSIVIQEGRPCKILAVVADFDADPPTNELWVREALASALAACEQRRLPRVAVQMLGTRFERSEEDTFINVFESVIEKTSLDSVRQIWLVRNPSP